MRTRVTAIPEDSMINVDGEVLFFAYEAPCPVRVLQWKDSQGQLEYDDVSQNTAFSADRYNELVVPFVVLWEAEKARLEEEANREPTLEEIRADAMERLRLRKWEAKDAGITVNGIAIDTDDRGQATINGAVTNVILDPAFTATWKTNATDEHGQSVWLVLDAAMIVGLSKAMTAYTEACFAVEAAKQAELAAITNAQDIRDWLELYLDDGWPGREITLAGA